MEKTPLFLKNNIAYIYKADSTSGTAFKNLLENNNCNVTLIEQGKAAATDYSHYKLIVIDHNTDAIGAGSWKSKEADAIKNAGKPVLLLGMGGLLLAEKLGNTANWSNAAQFSDCGFHASDMTCAVYHQPYAIPVPSTTPSVSLYPAAVLGAGQYAAADTLTNNTLIGNFLLAPQYYPVTFESSRYMTFGFFNGVDHMSPTGRNFMVNLCYYTGNLT